MITRTQCGAKMGMVVLDPDSPTGLSCDTGSATKEPVDPNSFIEIHKIIELITKSLKAGK